MHKHLFILFLLVIILNSCKKEHLELYNTSDSIYFLNSDEYTGYIDSSNITFAYANDLASDTVIGIGLKVTGVPTSTDRIYQIVADDSSTAISGVHYEPLPARLIFPANKANDTLYLKILRAPDLKDASVTLFLSLKSTETLRTNLQSNGTSQAGSPMSYVKYKVAISDILVQPDGWSSSFGKFTKKKLDIVCELGNVASVWFVAGDDETPIYTTGFNAKRGYMATLLRNYLFVNEINGTPVYYEDGTPMRVDD